MGEDNWQVVKLAVAGLGNFMNSSDRDIMMEHIKRMSKMKIKSPLLVLKQH